MLETSQQIYFIAAAVVGISLSILGYFLIKTIATANLFEKAVTLYKQKDYAGAETTLRRIIEGNRTNDMVRLMLGNSLLAQDQLDEAIIVFQTLIYKSPKNVDAYLRLGFALYKQGKLKEAIATLEKAKNISKPQSSDQQQIEQLIEQIDANKLNSNP